MNILVIDQNKQMRQAIKSLLADIADNIYECNDEEEAIVLSVYQSDWILTEVKIKEGNLAKLIQPMHKRE